MKPITPDDIQRAPSNLVFTSTDVPRTQNCSMLLLLNEVEKLSKELALLQEVVSLKEVELEVLGETTRNQIQAAQDEAKLLQRKARIDNLGAQLIWRPSD